MNGRRARQRRQEAARFHQEQSKLPPKQQDLRFRIGQLRRECDGKVAAIAQERNEAISEISIAAAEEITAVRNEYRERIKVASDNDKKRRVSKDAEADARRFGIAIPKPSEIGEILRGRT